MMFDFQGRQDKAATIVQPSRAPALVGQLGLHAETTICKHEFLGCYPGEVEPWAGSLRQESGKVYDFAIAKGKGQFTFQTLSSLKFHQIL